MYPVYMQSRTQSLQAFWSAGQRREDSGDIKFYYRRISAVKQWKPLRDSQSKKLNFFDVPQSLPGVAPLTKKPEDSGYEIGVYVTAESSSHVSPILSCLFLHLELATLAVQSHVIGNIIS